MQSNNAGVLAGATDVLVENNRLRLPTTSSTTAPAAGGALIIGRLDTAGRTVPAFIAQDGVVRDIQSALTRSSPMIWKAQHAGTTLSVPGGVAPTVVGTATAFTIATTNLVTYTPRLDYLVTVAATTAIAGFRGAVAHVTVGGPGAGLGGCRTGRVPDWAGSPLSGVGGPPPGWPTPPAGPSSDWRRPSARQPMSSLRRQGNRLKRCWIP